MLLDVLCNIYNYVGVHVYLFYSLISLSNWILPYLFKYNSAWAFTYLNTYCFILNYFYLFFSLQLGLYISFTLI